LKSDTNASTIPAAVDARAARAALAAKPAVSSIAPLRSRASISASLTGTSAGMPAPNVREFGRSAARGYGEAGTSRPMHYAVIAFLCIVIPRQLDDRA
jgi:hypothetical protein